VPPGRNGVPTPTGGAVRTAERTGKIPVERTGAARPRQARPKPAGGQGPFDVDDADPRVSSAPGVLDFGALRVPMPPGGEVSVEPSANGRMQAVHVNLPGGRLSVSALAAPKSSKLWPQLAKEIDASLREGGARVRSFKGEWGRELHATTGAATSVFVGVDGPRWMIYGVATGPTSDNAELDAELRRMLRGTVVVRGKSPYPVRTVLPLTTPEELADPAEQGDPTPTAVVPIRTARPPAAAEPEPARGRAPAEEPAWADPVQRIADAPEADVLPEDDDATAATGLATSAWPLDDRTGRPQAPEWTGEQRVPPRRRKAPPVAEVAAAITEPILISAVMGEPAAPTRETPIRDTPEREKPRRERAKRERNTPDRDAPVRGRPSDVEQPVTTRLPVVPAVPDAPPAAAADADPVDRAEPGIDAYFGWDRPARPEPAPDLPATPPAPDRPASRTPVDPLDPSAPVDTRWLDEPGITTAWESVTAGLAAGPDGLESSHREPERREPERREPERREPERPEPRQEPAAGPDWAEWARQELDRAVSGRASSAEVEQAPSSFWDRYGLQEPTTGNRAARRHSGPEDGQHAGQHGRGGRDDEIDPFTARRRSRQATRGKDPDAPAQPRRSADEADVTELPARTGRVHHLHGPDDHGIGDGGAGRSARSLWEDMSATRAPGLHGGDDVASQTRADRSKAVAPTDRADDRSGWGLGPGGSGAMDRIDDAGWPGGPGSVERPGRSRRSSESGSDAQVGRDVWSGGSNPQGSSGGARRSSGSDRSGRDGRSSGPDSGEHVGQDGWSAGSEPLGSAGGARRSAGSDRSGGADALDRAGRAGRSSGPDSGEQVDRDGWPAGSHPLSTAGSARRSGGSDRPGGADAVDRAGRAGRSSEPDPGEHVGRDSRPGSSDPFGSSDGSRRSSAADRSGPGELFGGGGPTDPAAGAGSSGGDPAARSGWADLSRAADAIGRAGRSDRTDADHAADKSGSPSRADSLFGGARRADGAPFETAPLAGWPTASEGNGPADPFRWIDHPDRSASSRPATGDDRAVGTDNTREWLDRYAAGAGRAGQRPDAPDRALPRRIPAEPPSPWAPDRPAATPDPWSAAPAGGAGTAGWTTGWPGTGSSGRRAEDLDRPGYEQPVTEPESGGRRRAEDAGGSTRLSVAELAQRAAREAADPRRSRRTRPGTDRPE